MAANKILGHEGILDAYGHVSVRHPDNPRHFLLCRARSPGERRGGGRDLVSNSGEDVVWRKLALIREVAAEVWP